MFRVGRVVVGLALATCFLVSCVDMEAYPTAGSVYRATFGAQPGPGVKLLQAGGRAFRDNSACYLRFQISPENLTTLLGPDFLPMTRDEYTSQTRTAANADPIAPWWDPLRDRPTHFQRSGQFHPTFVLGHATLAYDPDNQIANLFWEGSD